MSGEKEEDEPEEESPSLGERRPTDEAVARRESSGCELLS
jgi:hypothetical protein